MPSANPILDGELLRAFAAFAETRNFTHAARQVGLSQPALFERVQRLADAVGAALYAREGRALQLTDAGARVAAFARETLARAGTFVDELHGEAARESVVLAAGEGAYLYLLGPALQAFARDDPAELQLLTRGARDAVTAVREGAAHLGVAVLDLVPDGLCARDLVRTPLCVALHAGHRLAARRSLRLADLRHERLVLAPAGQSHRDIVGRALAGVGRLAAPPIEADGWPLMLHFTALGLGVAVVNGCCKLPRGVVARRVRELGEVTYRLIWRRGAALPPAAVRLADRIVAPPAASRPRRAKVMT
jgi:LysR family transcriptional regulator, low CO2-responsive transcriptional regulator